MRTDLLFLAMAGFSVLVEAFCFFTCLTGCFTTFFTGFPLAMSVDAFFVLAFNLVSGRSAMISEPGDKRFGHAPTKN